MSYYPESRIEVLLHQEIRTRNWIYLSDSTSGPRNPDIVQDHSYKPLEYELSVYSKLTLVRHTRTVVGSGPLPLMATVGNPLVESSSPCSSFSENAAPRISIQAAMHAAIHGSDDPLSWSDFIAAIAKHYCQCSFSNGGLIQGRHWFGFGLCVCVWHAHVSGKREKGPLFVSAEASPFISPTLCHAIRLPLPRRQNKTKVRCSPFFATAY